MLLVFKAARVREYLAPRLSIAPRKRPGEYSGHG
jgi:hypothetical protein